jgi:hypothetical protein
VINYQLAAIAPKIRPDEREPGFNEPDNEPDVPIEDPEDEEEIINDEDDEPDDEDIPRINTTENRA